MKTYIEMEIISSHLRSRTFLEWLHYLIQRSKTSENKHIYYIFIAVNNVYKLVVIWTGVNNILSQVARVTHQIRRICSRTRWVVSWMPHGPRRGWSVIAGSTVSTDIVWKIIRKLTVIFTYMHLMLGCRYRLLWMASCHTHAKHLQWYKIK